MSNLIDLEAEYLVRWRNWTEVIPLYTYSRELQQLQLVTAGYDLLFRVEQDSDQLAFIVADEYSLFIDTNGRCDVGKLSNRSLANIFPRVELIRLLTDVPEVVAAITVDGTLVVQDATEGPLPAGTDQMVFFNKVSFGPAGLTAVSINEVALLGENGAYLTEGGVLI
jgi:hypothetical protein